MGNQRPWEGTALAVIDIIGVVGAFLMAILFLFLRDFFAGFMGMGAATGDLAAYSGAGFFAGLGMGVAVIFIAFGVLAVFMTRGAFKGQKWSPIVSLVFAVLGVLSFLSGLGHVNSSALVSLLISLFMGYCGYMCYKNAYYK